MKILEVLLPALIAAIISYLASLQALRSQREQQRQELNAQRERLERELQSQKEHLERELQRKFTEKLYDLRLDMDPQAFEITDQLRGEYIFKGNLNQETLKEVRTKIQDWNKTKAGFLLSQNSLKAFYELRKSLGAHPEDNGKYSDRQRKQIWQCKNRFRGALKADVNLLYAEEEEPDQKY